MPDIRTIQDAILARIAELEKLLEPLRLEAQELTKMAAGFGDTRDVTQPPGRRAPKPAATARRPKRPRSGAASPATGARRGRPPGSGNRAHQALAKIGEQPGITAAELAVAMGIGPNYLYRVLPRLEREGKVTKRGKGYHPGGGGDTEDAAPDGAPEAG